MKLSPNVGSDRSWVWNAAADVSEGEPEPQTLAIRFANSDSMLKPLCLCLPRTSPLVCHSLKSSMLTARLSSRRQFIQRSLHQGPARKRGIIPQNSCRVDSWDQVIPKMKRGGADGLTPGRLLLDIETRPKSALTAFEQIDGSTSKGDRPTLSHSSHYVQKQ